MIIFVKNKHKNKQKLSEDLIVKIAIVIINYI